MRKVVWVSASILFGGGLACSNSAHQIDQRRGVPGVAPSSQNEQVASGSPTANSGDVLVSSEPIAEDGVASGSPTDASTGVAVSAEDKLFPLHSEELGGRRIWRLTVPQLGNTVRDVLGSQDAIEGQFDSEIRPASGLGVESDILGIDTDYASKLETVLGPLMQASSSALATYLPCGSVVAVTPDCLDAFINAFGAKAFRRPLVAAEVQRYATVFATVQPLTGDADGVAAVAEALLRSPYAQFRLELGSPDAAAPVGSEVQLNSYELASALAYAITNGPPDAQLTAAAANGSLLQPGVVSAQVQRLMASPAYVNGFTEFFMRFSGVTWLGNASKDATLFPDYGPAMMQAMTTEVQAFVKDVMTTKNGDFTAFMTNVTTTVTPPMAEIYQVPAFTGSQQLTAEAGQRAGFYTLPAVIAANSKAADTSPVKRGVFLLDKLVCVSPSPPPANVPSLPAATDPTATLRQRFTAHVANPSCAGCHKLIDPLGFALENYDPIGRYRTTDSGSAVDATGTVVGTEMSNVNFTSAVDLLTQLENDPEIHACLVRNAFRYVFGRDETPGDAPVLRAAFEQFVAAKLNINQLLASFYTAKAFQFRKAD